MSAHTILSSICSISIKRSWKNMLPPLACRGNLSLDIYYPACCLICGQIQWIRFILITPKQLMNNRACTVSEVFPRWCHMQNFPYISALQHVLCCNDKYGFKCFLSFHEFWQTLVVELSKNIHWDCTSLVLNEICIVSA